MRPWPRTSPLATALAACLWAACSSAPVVRDEKLERALSGEIRTRYRGRFTGDESDHDLTKTLDLGYRDPKQRFEASLLARAAWDIDGADEGGNSDFFGLSDTYDHRLTAQLYHAYVDVRVPRFERLRAGRQPLYDTPVTVVIDGLLAELAPRTERGLSAGAYAGLGEHPYESSSAGDTVAGAFGTMSPWKGAELRADWMHLEDERVGIDHENELLGLAGSQDFRGGEALTRIEGRFTSLEGNGRDARLSANYLDPQASLRVQASLYRLLQTQRELAAPLDPFSSALFELFPYTQLDCSASKDWQHLSLLGGANLRRVDDDDDVGDFNRDFERYYVTGTVPETLWVDLSLTGEVWRATDTDYETWGAEFARALEGGWNLSLGSYYALYEVDLTSGAERDHVRTTYLDVRFKPSALQRWALRYEFEKNDIDDYHEVRVDYTWSF